MTAIPHQNIDAGSSPASAELKSIAPIDTATGPAAAALTAGGLGCAAMGLLTTLAEASPAFKKALNLYDPVGPLSGKVAGAIIVYVLSWIVLGLVLRHQQVHLIRWLILTFILVACGLIFTFPPVYDLFTVH